MEDDSAETGSGGADVAGPGVDPGPDGEVTLDPVADHAARDAEFELFYLQEMPKLVAFLLVCGAGPTQAADIAQEAMTAAYKDWNMLDAPRAWTRTVARRTWWRLAAQDRTEQPHEDVPEPSGLLSPVEASELAQRHTVLNRLRALPPAQREVMALTYDGYQPTEIAGLLHKRPDTVRSLLRAAREHLRRQDPSTEETE